jgi:hypothetical protein
MVPASHTIYSLSLFAALCALYGWKNRKHRSGRRNRQEETALLPPNQ